MSSSVELGSGFGRFLAAKIEFSYGAGQTVNRIDNVGIVLIISLLQIVSLQRGPTAKSEPVPSPRIPGQSKSTGGMGAKTAENALFHQPF
jgi:hypothetical protein